MSKLKTDMLGTSATLFFLLLFTWFAQPTVAQEAPLEVKLENPSFELRDRDTKVPLAWIGFGEGVDIQTDAQYRSHGRFSAKLIASRGEADGGFNQRFAADGWRGKALTIKLMARVESLTSLAVVGAAQEVRGEAEVWVGIYEGISALTEATEKVGGSGWRQHRLSLFVPKEATEIRLGVRLMGSGVVWVDDFRLE